MRCSARRSNRVTQTPTVEAHSDPRRPLVRLDGGVLRGGKKGSHQSQAVIGESALLPLRLREPTVLTLMVHQ